MSNTKFITIKPILTMPPKFVAFAWSFQADGPTAETQGYAVAKIGDDDLPIVQLVSSDLQDAIRVAKRQAVVCRVPFHRPEWLKKLLPDVVSIQIVPYITDNESGRQIGDEEIIVPQFEGPTDKTKGWAVYLRQETGEVMWVADVGTQSDAEFIGQKYAEHRGVEIEPYPWLAAKGQIMSAEKEKLTLSQIDAILRKAIIDTGLLTSNDKALALMVDKSTRVTLVTSQAEIEIIFRKAGDIPVLELCFDKD